MKEIGEQEIIEVLEKYLCMTEYYGSIIYKTDIDAIAKEIKALQQPARDEEIKTAEEILYRYCPSFALPARYALEYRRLCIKAMLEFASLVESKEEPLDIDFDGGIDLPDMVKSKEKPKLGAEPHQSTEEKPTDEEIDALALKTTEGHNLKPEQVAFYRSGFNIAAKFIRDGIPKELLPIEILKRKPSDEEIGEWAYKQYEPGGRNKGKLILADVLTEGAKAMRDGLISAKD